MKTLFALLLSFALAFPAYPSGRLFNGSSDRLDSLSAPLTDFPATICGLVRANVIDVNHIFVQIQDDGVTNVRLGVRVNTNEQVAAFASGTTFRNSLKGTVAINTWHWACGVYASGTSRIAYLDGIGGTDDANTVTLSNIDSITIGAAGDSSASDFWGGDVCWIVVWNAVLTPEEMSAFASGAHPMRIRPLNRVFAGPLWGGSPEINLSGGALTVTGSTATATGCPMPLWSGVH